MIQEQFIEDIFIESIAKIDFSENNFDNLQFIYGKFDEDKKVITQGRIDKDTDVVYPVLIYILPEGSKININNSDRTYRSGTPTLYLMNVSDKNYNWSEFRTNVLEDLGVLKIQLLEAIKSVVGKKNFGEIDEYIHQWLSIKAQFLSNKDLFAEHIGGYEMKLNININKKEICNG